LTIQRNYTTRRKTKQKHNKICVLDIPLYANKHI